MQILSLKTTTRPDTGKGAAHRLRATGLVPGVLYGGGQDPVGLCLDEREFDLLIHHGRSGEHAILQLEFEDQPDLNTPVLVKEVQHHPIRDTVIHVDFFRIRLDERIQTAVPVELTGQAAGVVEGGVVDHQLRELEVECMALEVPEVIQVDVSALNIGDGLHVSDITVPENVTVLTEPDRPVAAVLAPRLVVEEAAEEAAEEGEEGEAGEEEGAEPEVIGEKDKEKGE